MTAAPTFRAPGQPDQPPPEPDGKPKGPYYGGGRQANLRPCPECGGLIPTPEGKPFPPHGQYVMGRDPNSDPPQVGIYESDQPCDGEGQTATRTYPSTKKTAKTTKKD